MTWTISPTVVIDGVTYNSNTIGNLTISKGRTYIWETMRAGYASIQLINTTDTASTIDINDPVTIKLKDFAGTSDITVFTGVVATLENNVMLYSGTTTLATMTITAVGNLSRVARTQSSLVDYPEESDSARISRILAECSVTSDTVDGATYTMMARPATTESALNLLNLYALTATGSIYETSDGKVGFANQYRRNADVLANGYFNIDPTFINFNNLKSNLAISDVFNSLNVKYSAGIVSFENSSSIAAYGKISSTMNTEILTAADANSFASLMIGMRAYPQTNLTDIEIRLDDPDMNSTTLNKMLNIYFGMPIQISGAPVAIFPSTYYGFVEGWTITFNSVSAKINLRTSYKTYSYRPTVWSAVNPATQWTGVGATTTWATYE